MKNFIRHSRSGFTLIELLVGMMIFSVGITGIFLLLQTTTKSVAISRNEIIVANLLREQMELIRYQRDINVVNAAPWNAGINEKGGIYTVENNFDETSVDYQATPIISPVKFIPTNIADINNFDQGAIKSRFNEETQLCYKDKSKHDFRYGHCKD